MREGAAASRVPTGAEGLHRLRCPHCAASLAAAAGSLRCERGHSYDVARQGYVSLLPARRGKPHSGDSAEMVAAREAFLAGGHYEAIAEAIADAAHRALGPHPSVPGCVADFGAGTGYHLAALLDGLPGWCGLAFDSSRPALRRAARASPRIVAVASDVWAALPLHDASIDLGLNVFAPRNGREIARVLAPHGALVVVTPTTRHLRQLAPVAGVLAVGEDKQDRLRERLSAWLRGADARTVDFELMLGHDDVRRVVAMGPGARHVHDADLDRWLALQPEQLDVTASVVVETFRHR